MQVRERGIERRKVIEFYVTYESAKKELAPPNFSAWDWANADALDRELERAKLKHGIVAGYLEWDLAELNLDDLRRCAIVNSILPNQPQALSLLEARAYVQSWKPDRQSLWYGQVCGGKTLDQSAALILRPAVSTEAPAEWYLEDGSGRALVLLANASVFDVAQVVGVAYRGCVPDPDSSFLKKRFPPLLGRR